MDRGDSVGDFEPRKDGETRDKVEVVAEQVGDVLLSVRTGPRFWRGIALLVAALLLLNVVLGWYWSREPSLFPVQRSVVAGQATTTALMGVVETLLDKPGGYLGNDILPHRLWLDDMPSWEAGVLGEVRGFAGVLRQQMGRDPQRHLMDADLAEAGSQFNFSSRSWAIPSTEGEYRRGIQALARYRDRLALPEGSADKATFRTDEAVLNAWLVEVDARLGKLVRVLSNSVGQEPVRGLPADDGLAGGRTPWLELDNVFYNARGHAWALTELLRGAQADFADVLEARQAAPLWRQAMAELEATQQFVWSPMILNGSGFGVLANHSLMLANYLARARSELAQVRLLLGQQH